MQKYIAGKNEGGLSALKFVKKVAPDMPLSLIHKAFRKKRIKINDSKANIETIISVGDIIELYINDEFLSSPIHKNEELNNQNISNSELDILFEDENIAFICKPAGMLTHSDTTGDVSLQQLFVQQLVQNAEYNPETEVSFVPAVCNRLDRGTRGIVIGAKNYPSLRDMNMLISQNKLQKTYKCICYGKPPEGRHRAFLLRDDAAKKVKMSSVEVEGSKEIITEVKIMHSSSPFYLCEINLVTGRKHQIRAHLAFLGAPILGDSKYGLTDTNNRYSCFAQQLCSYSVEFTEKIEPSENTLAYLAGEKIISPCPELDTFWHKIAKV